MENMLEKFQTSTTTIKKEHDFLNSMTETRFFKFGFTGAYEQLIQQDGFMMIRLPSTKLTGNSVHFLSEINDKILNILTNLQQSLLQNLKMKWELSRKLRICMENALPKRKILNDAISNMKSYVVETEIKCNLLRKKIIT